MVDSKLSEMVSTEPVKKSRSKTSKKRRRNPKVENDEYSESFREAKKLKEKFSSKKRAKDDDMAFLKIGVSENGLPKIQNSETHNNLLKRAEEAQLNRTFQIELRADALQTLWMCALCHQRSAQEELGDLFGPYYVNIRCEGHWPSFLLRKSLKV
uniref:CW-type domain-containing protein n=1 Tax=Angiostrongylus cantonensis TaxID=6313 RepID=A0A0K0CTM4_ANGCA